MQVRWDLLSEGCGKSINIFFAGAGFTHKLLYDTGARKRLVSWHANTDEDIDEVINHDKKFGDVFLIVDSGAFTAWNKGDDIDATEYSVKLHALLDYFDIAANLDVIPGVQGMKARDITKKMAESAAREGWDNYRFLRAIHGNRIMPIYHQGESMNWLKRMVDSGADYIGISPSNDYHTTQRMHWLDDVYDYLCSLPILPKTHGYAVTSPVLMKTYPWFCMTPDHQVLTKKGWRYHEYIHKDDLILAYENGQAVWQAVIDVHRYNECNTEVIELFNKKFSTCTTLNHRWFVETRSGKIVWKTTKELCHGDKIPKVAKSYSGGDSQYSDDLVELMAWFWTDGTVNNRPKYRNNSITIYQSEKANAYKVDVIRDLLARSGEQSCEMKPNNGMVAFECYGEMSRKILELAPDKCIPIEFITGLSERQVKLFVKTSVFGDGHTRKGYFSLSQGSMYESKLRVRWHNIEMFSIAATLAGYPVTITESDNGQFKEKVVTSSIVPVAYYGSLHKRVLETNFVWCVSVPSGAFFTRRNNMVCVTGNSVDSASWIHKGGWGVVSTPHGDVIFTDREEKMTQPGGFYSSTWSPEMRELIIEYCQRIGTCVEKLMASYQERWRANAIHMLSIEKNYRYKRKSKEENLFTLQP